MCSSAPDMTGVNNAAQQSAALGQETLDWYKQLYAETAPDRKVASDVALDMGRTQVDAAKKQIALADESADRIRTVQQPLEDTIISDAKGYDTPSRRAAEREGAMADVEGQLEIQRAAAERRLMRSGVAPGSAKEIALGNTMSLETAKARAGAGNVAEHRVEAVGAAKMNDAAALMRNLPSAQATQLQTGANVGTAGVGATMQPLAIAGQGAAMMGQGFDAGLSGYRTAGSLYGQAAGMEANASANNNSTMGSLAGAAAMALAI